MKNQRLKSILLIAAAFILYGCNEQFLEKGISPIQTNSSAFLSQSPVVSSKTEVPNDAYIIVFKDQTTDKEIEDEVGEIDKSEGVKADHVYKNAIKGFAARLSPSAYNKLKNNTKVAFIEKDQVMSANVTVTPPSWGIDRIDQASLPLSKSFTYTSNGTGVDAYIIDTGILISHTDFVGRVVGGYSSVGSITNFIDQNGHGTHVAGTVGGTNYGVAKNVNLIAVRVLDANGSGSTSGVIDGINWAISRHKTKIGTAVANMSLGGGVSAALDLAVSNAVAANIVMCVAAGNSKLNASNFSPARVAAAITVGATGSGTNYDAFATYSNYGSIVDILAPGSSITSDWFLSNTSTKILSGTSMATPHVTGVVAQYLSKNTSATPSAVEAFIKDTSTKGKITGLKQGTPNTLLYSNN
jgi:subtilisin family serine protease